MNKPFACAALGATLLSGCFPSTDLLPTEPELAAPVVAGYETHGVAPAGLDVTYNEASDEVTLDDGTSSVVIRREPVYDGDEFRGYYQGTGEYVFYAPTASGEAYSALAIRSGGTIGAAVYGRTAQTAVPGTGTASYSGDYVSMLVREDGNPARLIFGRSDLTADFGAGTISGVISNRSDFSDPGTSYADVTLSEAGISGGRFSGTVTGGAGNSSYITTVSDGSYKGMMAGPNGEEVVGGVIIPHVYGGTDNLTEYGAFMGD